MAKPTSRRRRMDVEGAGVSIGPLSAKSLEVEVVRRASTLAAETTTARRWRLAQALDQLQRSLKLTPARARAGPGRRGASAARRRPAVKRVVMIQLIRGFSSGRSQPAPGQRARKGSTGARNPDGPAQRGRTSVDMGLAVHDLDVRKLVAVVALPRVSLEIGRSPTVMIDQSRAINTASSFARCAVCRARSCGKSRTSSAGSATFELASKVGEGQAQAKRPVARKWASAKPPRTASSGSA